jgi:hypothetical protein
MEERERCYSFILFRRPRETGEFIIVVNQLAKFDSFVNLDVLLAVRIYETINQKQAYRIAGLPISM